MDQKHFVLRDAEEKDYDFILRVNEENVEVLSPMPLERLKLFKEHANVLQVAEIDGELAAFIICMREGDDWYDSENYLWFCKTYPKFLYVDRIVLDEPFRHKGLGKFMYEAMFAPTTDRPCCSTRSWASRKSARSMFAAAPSRSACRQ